ncbi:MAG TPA: beta-propeller fold lactonase family protein [Isosphaeraceae bacterium]|jgi:6-phosphogluconolactonase (cycloisomerase 2 family)|nr:beta-propeller fold lactonase family protein [Isosphaeraceae bacterium]
MFDHEGIALAKRRPHRPASARFPLTQISTALVLLALGGLMAETAAEEPDKAKDVVYVESNDPAGNAIFAFERHDDGSLTPLPGSPFPAGGAGITPTFDLGPFDSDQEVIVNPSHTLLFAVNGGSDTIAVFQINQDGSLTHVKGSPFPSGGSNPVSVGLAGNILCVVNKDQDPGHPGQFLPNYTSFRVTSQGKLIPVPFSTVFVDAGASPSQALTSPNGNLLFGADFMGGLLRSFVIADGGRLLARAALPLPAAEFADSGAPPFPLGLAVHPERPLLYVGFVTISRLGVYHYSSSGALRFLRTVPSSGHGMCWVLLNKDATRLYTSNTGDPSVSVYDTSDDPAEPVEIQRVNMKSSGGGFEFGLDSTGKFLHVVTQQSAPTSDVSANAIHVFKVADDGKLTEVPSSPTVLPVPNFVRPQGVVAL